MKQFVKRFVVLFVALALVFGLMPDGSAQAAKKKKTKTVTVTTQEELVAALKKYKSSGSKVTIKIETNEKSTFTLNAKYSSDSISIVVDAPNATVKSKATVSSITINEAKSVKEYASGNKITVNDEKLTFTAMENASVEKLTIASETGTVKVVNNGGIEKVAVKSEVKVDLTQNGEVGRVYVGAAADISVSGTAEKSLKVTVQKDAVGASVKSEVPVSVNAYADVDLTLEKGAENSKVTMKEETAGVKLENKTEETVSIKDTDGNTKKVETGEEHTSDNYVGKPEETETPAGGTETEQPKEEEKKEEEKKEDKKEEKKDDTATETGGGSVGGGSVGGGSEGGSYTPTPSVDTPEKKLLDGLASAKTGDSVLLTGNVVLSDNLTIPSGIAINLAGYTLDAESKNITFEPDSRIYLETGSKLIVARDAFLYTPDEGGEFTHAEIELKYDSVFKIGDYTFTGPGSGADPFPVKFVIENFAKDELVPKDPDYEISETNPGVSLKYTERNIRMDFLGGALNISGTSESYKDIPKAFGSEKSAWVYPDPQFGLPQNGDVFTTIEIDPHANVMYDKRTVTYNNATIFETETSVEDWLNCYLDPMLYWYAYAAENQLGKKAPAGIERAEDDNGQITVTVTDPTLSLTKNVYVREDAALIANDIVYKLSSPVEGPVGGDFKDNPGIKVAGSLSINSITSAGFFGDNQQRIKMQNAYSTLKKGNRYYRIQTDESKLKEDPYATAYSYCCWNASKQYYGYMYYTWDYDFTLQASDDGTDYYTVVGSPVSAEPVKPGTPLVTVDADQVYSVASSTTRWTDWSDTDDFNDEIYLDKEDRDSALYKDCTTLDQYYDAAAKARLNFTSATISSNGDASAEYGGKKVVKLEAYIKDDEGNNTDEPTWMRFAGTALTVDPDVKVELENKAEIRIERGSSLEVASVSAGNDKSGQLIIGCDFKKDGSGSYVLDDFGNRLVETAGIIAQWGGELIIDGMVFQCPNHDNDWDRGKPAVQLDVMGIGQDGLKVRLQVGEDAIITKKDGTVPTVDEFNTWLQNNNLFFEINYAEPLADHYFDENGERTAELESDGDREYREMISEWHTPYVKLGAVNAFISRANKKYNTLVSGTVTGTENVFHVKNEWELLDVWAQIDQSDNSGNGGKECEVYIEPTDAENNELCVSGYLGQSWTIIVPEGKTLKINPRNALSGNIKVATGGTIEIIGSNDEEQAHLYTQAGATIEVFGTINVLKGEGEGADNGRGQGHFCSHFGGKVVISEGGILNLDGGIFDCAYVDAGSFVVKEGGRVTTTAPGCVKLWKASNYTGTDEELLEVGRQLRSTLSIDVDVVTEEIAPFDPPLE